MVDNKPPTYAFEHVFAKLEPFDLNELRRTSGNDHALRPIVDTGGLVFPFNPTISEGINVKYDSMELTHSNESYNAYKSTENVNITLTDCIWTCDTFENARYALAALHFFRSYSLMDFGRGRSGRPPSPMWFTAFGNYAFYRVPTLLQKADWSFPKEIDYVGIPEPGSMEYTRRILQKERSGGNYTWLPMIFTINTISLVVQHSPRYWINFNLNDYRSGEMVRQSLRTFHEN